MTDDHAPTASALTFEEFSEQLLAGVAGMLGLSYDELKGYYQQPAFAWAEGRAVLHPPGSYRFSAEVKHEPERSAYQEGWDAAMIPPPDQPKNPYPEGDPRHEQWSDGYGECTEDTIRWNGGEYDFDD